MSRVTINHNAPYSVIVDRGTRGSSQHILLLNDGTELKSQLNKAVLCGRQNTDGWVVNNNPVSSRICVQCRRAMRNKEASEG